VAAFIASQRDDHGIPHAIACRALGVSQSWFYKWKPGCCRRGRRAGKDSKPRSASCFAVMRANMAHPGSLRTCVMQAWTVSENTVAALMRQQGFAARRRRRRRGTTRPSRGRWRAPDLVKRDFAAEAIHQKWYGDQTEIPTGEGKLYLASVLDGGSRRVVGFALSEHPDAQLAYGALTMAVAVRGGQVPGVIMHTDCGSEYTAKLFRAACGRLQIRQSMGRPGSALDNAVIEAWHSTLTFELRSLETFRTKAAARARVPAWIDHYNRQRRHSACGMLSPIDYELAQARQAA
jgi:putative transposase